MALLTDRVVVISGVGPGLGSGIARACASHGADIVLAARTSARLDAVAAAVEAGGGRALAVPTDVTDESACSHLIGTVLEHFGRIDGLVNNAFVQPPFEPLEAQSLDTVRRSFEINLFSALTLSRLAIPPMRAAGRGSIVMVNSAILRHSRPMFGAYKMAKHALLGLARSLATECGPDGIRVNSVAPGYIWGDAVEGFLRMSARQRGVPYEEVLAEVQATHALGRIPTPDEIADVVVFLLSDLARVVTGQCLDVNAGEYQH